MSDERWTTIRRCHECLQKGNTNYLEAQKWGKNEDGKQLFRLTCRECGPKDTTTWEGR